MTERQKMETILIDLGVCTLKIVTSVRTVSTPEVQHLRYQLPGAEIDARGEMTTGRTTFESEIDHLIILTSAADLSSCTVTCDAGTLDALIEGLSKAVVKQQQFY